MQRFIADQNIQHFKAALAHEKDESRRVVLERLLAEEQAKLAKERAAARPAPDEH